MTPGRVVLDRADRGIGVHGGMVTDCDLCRRATGLYDFNRVCCRVRFILVLPNREMRVGWLERWRKRDGNRLTDEIEMEVKARWGTRR